MVVQAKEDTEHLTKIDYFARWQFLLYIVCINIYVQRKVRIGTIPELYLRIVRIPTLSADSVSVSIDQTIKFLFE